MTAAEIANELESLKNYIPTLWDRLAEAETNGEKTRIERQQTACAFRVAQLENMQPKEAGPRKASSFCKSGGRDNCTCDVCF